MKNLAFIWDLDGTLLDSYGVICFSVISVYRELGLELNEKEVMEHLITYSSHSFFEKMEGKYGFSAADCRKRYSQISGEKKADIKLMPFAKDVLSSLSSRGDKNFVFTHRGVTTESVLKRLGIFDCFEEIITSQSPFPRKPAPNAINYLIEKYRLERGDTFYVGDRSLDMECAKNARVKSVLYLPPQSVGQATGNEDYIVKHLKEILSIGERNK